MGKFMKIGLTIAGALVVLVGMNYMFGGNTDAPNTDNTEGTGLVIAKSEITETAKFYPYQFGETKMEILAVKANDGTIRTAFNTCQVCYDSGRGYYIQEGNELVCQNCRNRFQIDQVEIMKGGCNPVPIMEENKTEDDEQIVISHDFIAANAGLFANWGK